MLLIAHQWAVVHPATEESGVSTWGGEALLADESLGGEGCPQVAAYAPEPLAITLGVSPVTAKQLITDALELRHRLPETWKRVAALEVPAWKGRHVAVLTHTLSLEAAAWVDQQIAPRLHRCGAKAVDTVVAHAIAKYDPARHAEREQRAKKQIWDVALHTPVASEYAATSELHIIGHTSPSPTSTAVSAPTPPQPGRPATTSPSASARSRRWPPCSPAWFRDGRCATSSNKRRLCSTCTWTSPSSTTTASSRSAEPSASARSPPTRSATGSATQRPHPARHPDGRRRRRQRPRPTRPNPRPGHPPRPDLPFPRLPSRFTKVRPRPRHPLRPDRSAPPDPTLQPRPAEAVARIACLPHGVGRTREFLWP